MNQPFDIRGLKIAVSNGFGQYNDLLGATLDRSTYQPWSDVIEQMRLTGANTVTLVVSAGVMARSNDSGFDPAAVQSPDTAVIAKPAQAIRAAGMSVAINPFVTVAGVIAGDPSQAASSSWCTGTIGLADTVAGTPGTAGAAARVCPEWAEGVVTERFVPDNSETVEQ